MRKLKPPRDPPPKVPTPEDREAVTIYMAANLPFWKQINEEDETPMVDTLLENAEVIDRPVPQGMYRGPVPQQVKDIAGEVLRSVQGQMEKQQRHGYEPPTARVSARGTVQLLWKKPWGQLAIAVRGFDQGGSVGLERFSTGDTPPDPELMTSYPLGHVVAEVVGWMSREN
jgi:hypothetical protein